MLLRLCCAAADPQRHTLPTHAGVAGAPVCEGGVLVGDSALYRGELARTISGRPCQTWTQATPHALAAAYVQRYGAAAGLSGHNFCRNPDGSSAVW